MFVLALPLAARSDLFTLVAFVGGLSAATAMVIVEIGRARHHGVERHRDAARCCKRRGAVASGAPASVGWLLLTVRRIAIFAILLLAYMYYRSAGDAQLGLDRPSVVRRHRAARAGLLRRPDLAARHRPRRHGRHDASASWSGPIRCCCRASPTPASSARASSARARGASRWLRPQALFGPRPAAASSTAWF